MRDPIRSGPLRRAVAPAQVRVWSRLGSTQQRAIAMLEAGRLRPPALLVAAHQTAGIGRGTNRWWADEGSLCATLVLPVVPAMPVGQVPLRAGLAVAETLARHLPPRTVQVKWPNDVWMRGRKLAGILSARVREADVIGIGINVTTDLRRAPADVRAIATSLREWLPAPPSRAALLVEIWQAVLATRAATDWMERYRKRHALENRLVLAELNGRLVRGRCEGLDNEGRLRLAVGGAHLAITEATVQLCGRSSGQPKSATATGLEIA
ncbi:MAG: biotin--[acetyl-CoA-carboxylase] ligase [Kiritimatiellae bacterium]|nr:biotin--[acetyl-CoA-carboxylase] ligase [Kiritimatiellia bacterium]